MSLDESDKPEEPTEEDCCNNGCNPCVFDIYKKQLKLWEEKNSIIDKSKRYDLLSLTCFKPFILKKITSLTVNTNLYEFQPGNGGNNSTSGILPYNVGQHLILRFNNNGKIITRAYTVVSNKDKLEHCTFEVLIKIYPNGLMSNYVKTWSVNDTTYWRGPYGDFQYESNRFKNILMICIGTGIAPMYAIIQEIINNENDETNVKLFYGCRSISEIILREELLALSSYWNFSYTCFLSQSFSDGEKKYSEKFECGKISKEIIEIYLRVTQLNNLQVLICGSTDFADNILDVLLNFKILKENIFIF